jgi:hypothetical protein
MVARNSSAVRIEICDGYGLCGLTATGNKERQQQNSRSAKMSEAMRCNPTLIHAAHRTTDRPDSDGKGKQFSPPLQRQE